MYKNIFTNKKDIEEYKAAGRISAEILSKIKEATKIGVTPKELDTLAGQLCIEYGVEPSFKGVEGPKDPFPANLCVCVNDETLHAIPYSEIPLKSGDIVKLDFGIIYNGFFTDHCVTVGLGELTEEELRLINTAKLAVDTAIKKAVEGNRIGDISNVIGSIAELSKLTVIRGFAGHGIGRSIHEEPLVPYEGYPNSGPRLVEGMILCIEVQLSLGSGRLRMDKDGWTLRTEDGSKTAMHEHVVMVGKKSPLILTKMS